MWEQLTKTFIEKNKQINLSAIRDPDGILIKHIYDSIELNKILTIKNGKMICDIGTGGGFPLLPLAISHPKSFFVGIDARKKKVNAVNEIADKLGLKNVKCVWSRIEDFKSIDNTKFDYITARAVGYIDKIIARSYDILKKGGSFIFYKQYNESEYQTLSKLCRSNTKYKLSVTKKHKYKLFDKDIERVIYIIKKH